MARYENIFDKIQELLGVIPGGVSILEQQVDSDVQNEYYSYAQNVKKPFDREDILRNRNEIFEKGRSVEDRKEMIIKLASIDHVDAYRTLEKCTGTMTDELKDWAILALQENRLLLESRLLDQNRILISTGLGGKGLALRYFTVLMSVNEYYTEFEQLLFNNEIQYAFSRINGEPESIQFDREICTIVGLIPLPVAVQKFFDDIITECNLYGNFINTDYIVTNVRVISNDEIRRLASFRKNKTRKNDLPGYD